jgi:hypothetical protein
MLGLFQNFWRCMHDCSELMRAQPPNGLLRLVRSSAVETIAGPTFSELVSLEFLFYFQYCERVANVY